MFAWKQGVDVELTSTSSNFVNMMVYSDPPNTPWLVSCVYGPTRWHLRDDFWHVLDSVASSFGGPWLCMGDFNCLLADWEKQGGLPVASSFLNPLQNLINSHGLIDLGFHGSPFTWSNNRHGLANIRERLNRGLANCQWRSLFPRVMITHLTRSASDHSPLLIDMVGGAPPYQNLSDLKFFGCRMLGVRMWFKAVGMWLQWVLWPFISIFTLSIPRKDFLSGISAILVCFRVIVLGLGILLNGFSPNLLLVIIIMWRKILYLL